MDICDNKKHHKFHENILKFIDNIFNDSLDFNYSYTYIYNYIISLDYNKKHSIRSDLYIFYNNLLNIIKNKFLTIILNVKENILLKNDLTNSFCIEYDNFCNSIMFCDKLFKFINTQSTHIDNLVNFKFLKYNNNLWKNKILEPLFPLLKVDYITIFKNIDMYVNNVNNDNNDINNNDINNNDNYNKIVNYNSDNDNLSNSSKNSSYSINNQNDQKSSVSSISSLSSYNDDDYNEFILLNFISKLTRINIHNHNDFNYQINSIINLLLEQLKIKLNDKNEFLKTAQSQYLIHIIDKIYNHYIILFKKINIYHFINKKYNELFKKLIIDPNINILLESYNNLLDNFNNILFKKYFKYLTINKEFDNFKNYTNEYFIKTINNIFIDNKNDFENILNIRNKIRVITYCAYDISELTNYLNELIEHYKYLILKQNKKTFIEIINNFIVKKIYNESFCSIKFNDFLKEILLFYDENSQNELMLLYKSFLIKRILKYDFNKNKFIKEIELVNNLVKDKSIIYKINKILNDVKTSYELMNQFNTIYLSSQTKQKYNIIVATHGIWPLSPNNNQENGNINSYSCFKKSFNDFYKCKFENRNLSFCDNLSSCILIYNTKKTNYEINCNLKQCDILLKFNDINTISKNEINNLNDCNIIKSLLKYKLIVENENNYELNKKFKCKKSKFNINTGINNIKNKKIEKKANEEIIFDTNAYIQLYIVRKLKQIKNVPKNELIDLIKEKYKCETKIIKENIDKCIDQCYIKLEDNIIIYLP